MQTPTVFLVDDDPDVRRSTERALVKRGFQVETYSSADAFLEVYDPERAGCLVLDHGMPNLTGLELQSLLIQRGLTLPIIFITGHGGVRESVQAMKNGAIDFLEKPFRPDALSDRLKAGFEIDAAQRKQQQFNLDVRQRYGLLTDREKEIAQRIVSTPSQTSSKDIARATGISPRTADHHRARIFEKMKIGSVAELVDLAARSELFANDE